MRTIRIPVSLKFETDTDFYQDFVLDMKEHRTLAGFIVDILKAYYENDDVRDVVNISIDANNPFTELKEHLQNIQLQHTKTVMATSMISNQNKSTLEDVLAEVEGGNQETPQHQTDQTNQENQSKQEPLKLGGGQLLETRIAELEKMLPSLEEKMNQMMNMMMQSNQATPTDTSNQNSAPIQEQPINSTSLEPKQEEIPVKAEEPKIEPAVEPVQEEPVAQPKPMLVQDEPSPVAPTIVFVDDDEEDEETPQTEQEENPNNAPPSLGKAFRSLNK